MSKQRLGDERHGQYIQNVRLAATLLDGPRTQEEISNRSYGYLKMLGFFKITERQVRDQAASMRGRLEELIKCGWVVHGGERYALTSLGREEVNKRLTQLGETGALIHQLLRPQTLSKVTLGMHLGLVALKLPTGLLSGSVGLINDSADTLLDGLSSLLVYFGIRFNKERSVAVGKRKISLEGV
jgi:hypothetical protein